MVWADAPPSLTQSASQATSDYPCAAVALPCRGDSLQSEHERYLAEEHCKRPVFITHYPAAIKPFYMRRTEQAPADRLTVACTDLLVPGIGELIGGSEREERVEQLRAQIATAGLAPEAYEWYVDLRRFGTVRHGGWGMGFERLLMWLTGLQNARDVIPVPRVPGPNKF
jgi:asparaginyl-tRNA synthetase